MSTAPLLPDWEPRGDMMAARWVRAVKALLRWLSSRAAPLRVVGAYNSGRAPIRYPVPSGTPEPTSVRLLRAVRSESGDRDLRVSGYAVEWYWRGRELEVSSVDGLAANQDYTLTMELL